MLSSCASTKIIELGGKASTKGMEVSQKALDVYTVLSQQAEIDKSQRDKITVITNSNPAIMSLPNNVVPNFSEELAPRIEAYQSLLNTYKAFTLLTDTKFGDKTQEAVSALQKSYNSIEKLPNLPTTVSAKSTKVSKMIIQEIQAKKIKKHNQILFDLTQLYIAAWDEDQKFWNEYIDLIYNNYSNRLDSLDVKKYDAKKITKNAEEPYNEEIVILMFRLEKRDKIVKQKNEIKKQLNDFGKALKELNKVHGEISKSKTDVSDVINMLNTIENLLKQK